MSISNEHLILIECCKNIFLRENFDQINKILNRKKINYKYLVNLSLEHRVSPILYDVLINNSFIIHEFPQYFINCLSHRTLMTKKENCYKNAALSEMLKEADRRNIKIIGIKGVALSISTYSSCRVERESRDIDILLESKDIEEICIILKNLGYVQGVYNIKKNKICNAVNEAIAEYEEQQPNHVWPFYRYTDLKNYALVIEPHRSIAYKNNPYQISTDEIIRCAYRSKENIYIPCLEHEMLILCLSAFYDYSSLENMKVKSDIRLRKYCDILNLSLRLNSDKKWNSFKKIMRENNCTFPVYQILNFCEELFDISIIPDDFFNEEKFSNDDKYLIYNISDFASNKPIGRWNYGFKEIFSDDNRYIHALDLLFCNCINTHYSCVRTLRQEGTFLRLRESND